MCLLFMTMKVTFDPDKQIKISRHLFESYWVKSFFIIQIIFQNTVFQL